MLFNFLLFQFGIYYMQHHEMCMYLSMTCKIECGTIMINLKYNCFRNFPLVLDLIKILCFYFAFLTGNVYGFGKKWLQWAADVNSQNQPIVYKFWMQSLKHSYLLIYFSPAVRFSCAISKVKRGSDHTYGSNLVKTDHMTSFLPPGNFR